MAHPLILRRGVAAARGGARYLRELFPADVAAGPGRDRLASAGADRRRPWTPGRPTWSGWPARRRAPGSSARSATRGSCARGRRSTSTRVGCATGARRSTTGWPRRWRTSPGGTGGTDDWAAVLEDAGQATTRPPRRRCATATSTGPSGRGPSWPRRAWSPCRRASGAWSSRRRSSSGRCWASPRTAPRRPSRNSWTGHFFVPFAPDGTPARGDPAATGGQQLGRHPHHVGARGVPRPPLAPGDAQAQPEPGAAGLRHALLQRGLGPVRRARDARARLLHGPHPGAVPPQRARCSGPPASSWTPASTWAR